SCVVLFLAASVGAQAAEGSDVANGKKLFVANTCYGCHGYSGQNGPGMRLVPMPFPTKAAFIARVRNPSQPRRMPAYSAKVVSDAQLGDIYTYLKTLKDAPPASQIPLLQEIEKEK
ncbi:MAG: c-type cytochrome, partial [Bryobacteraceae bacterium]